MQMAVPQKQLCNTRPLPLSLIENVKERRIQLIILNPTGTHVLPSPTDVLPNTTTGNVSVYCQVLAVGPKFTNSEQKVQK